MIIRTSENQNPISGSRNEASDVQHRTSNNENNLFSSTIFQILKLLQKSLLFLLLVLWISIPIAWWWWWSIWILFLQIEIINSGTRWDELSRVELWVWANLPFLLILADWAPQLSRAISTRGHEDDHTRTSGRLVFSRPSWASIAVALIENRKWSTLLFNGNSLASSQCNKQQSCSPGNHHNKPDGRMAWSQGTTISPPLSHSTDQWRRRPVNGTRMQLANKRWIRASTQLHYEIEWDRDSI